MLGIRQLKIVGYVNQFEKVIHIMVKYMVNISDEDVVELNLPTGIHIVDESNDGMKTVKHYYLGEPDKIKEKMGAIMMQKKG